MTAINTSDVRGDGLRHHAVATVKGDTFSPACKVYVGTAGNIIATTEGGNVDVTMKIPAGGETPCRITSIKDDAGTTATDMLAVW
jgi:hypothetical protein